MLPFFVIIPLASAFIVTMAGRRFKYFGTALAGLSSSALSVMSVIMAHALISMLADPAIKGGTRIIHSLGGWAPPAGIPFVLDGLSCFMLVVVNFVALAITIYSAGYTGKYTDQWKFYVLLSIMLAGMNGVILTGDIFNLYVFLEVAAIAGYFLVAFGIEPESLEASFKYAIMGSVASIFILLGIALLYGYTSTLNMNGIAAAIASNGPGPVLKLVSGLFLMGFGLKAALMPFHSWLPYAHSSAPAPVSAMLSGISIKVLGIYALTRIFFNVLGVSPSILFIIATLAVISMIVASIIAFGQSDIKRLFAYSSISQIGYIALGLAIATPLSVFGALLHLFNHSVFKSLLFLNSGSIEKIAGTRDLDKISGIISREPVTGYTTLVGALSICGMPPFGGFWSKLIIIFACIQAGRPFLALTAAAVSMLTLAYYFRALTPALFGARAEGVKKEKVVFAMALPMVALALVSALGAFMLMPNGANTILRSAANTILSVFYIGN